jgi:RNA-binding protein YlmH
MRLDVIIATAYNMSRNEANEFINSGLVNVNHIECLNNSKLIKENDVISVRHKGRIYVNEIIRKTKSDRLAIKIGFLK